MSSKVTSVILDALCENGICTKIINTTLESGNLNNVFKLCTDSGDLFVKVFIQRQVLNLRNMHWINNLLNVRPIMLKAHKRCSKVCIK